MKIRAQLDEEFDMKSLWVAKKIIGMEILMDRKAGRLYLTQKSTLRRCFTCLICWVQRLSAPPWLPTLSCRLLCVYSQIKIWITSLVPYASAVGSLMYDIICTCLDLAHTVSAISRYMENFGKEHWRALKLIFRYLHSSTKACLHFGRDSEGVIGYAAVTSSTTKAKYMAITKVCKEATCLRGLFGKISEDLQISTLHFDS